ncbi:hypothetical protein REPUB_Repub08aG0051700 [Reevesia pubescens]
MESSTGMNARVLATHHLNYNALQFGPAFPGTKFEKHKNPIMDNSCFIGVPKTTKDRSDGEAGWNKALRSRVSFKKALLTGVLGIDAKEISKGQIRFITY